MIKFSDLKILFIALAAASVIALVVRVVFFVDNSSKEKPVEVYVAVRDIAVGQSIQETLIRLQPMPKDLVVPDYIIASDDKENLIGSIVRLPLLAGEPLKRSGIIAVGQKGVLSALITPGKRAYTIPLGSNSAVSSLISPGDLVDVIVASRQPDSRTFQAKTVLEGVRVLEIDGSFKKVESGGGATRPPRYITVEVDEIQAQELAGELKSGDPTISLHSVKDPARNGLKQKQQETNPPVSEVAPPVQQETSDLSIDREKNEAKSIQTEVTVLRGSEKTVVSFGAKSEEG